MTQRNGSEPPAHLNGKAAQNPFSRGAICASALAEKPEQMRHLWFGIYPGKVTLLIGETGAGKSSLLYNIAVHAASNRPLWQVPFGLARPLMVLYIDPENAGNFDRQEGGLCAVKVHRIGQGRPSPLRFHDGQGVDLSKQAQLHHFREWIATEKFDLVILDPIANLFGTVDENDNAEAARQMRPLTDIARETGAAILIVHHTGKGEISGGNYGRGASARLGACDVGMMLRAKGVEQEGDDTYNASTGKTIQRSDLVRLQIVKNRIDGKGSIYLRMAGSDQFKQATFAEWTHAAGPADKAPPKSERAQAEIAVVLADGEWYDRQFILEKVKMEGYGGLAIAEAIKRMLAGKAIELKGKQGKGFKQEYRLTGVSAPPGRPDERSSINCGHKESELPYFSKQGSDESDSVATAGNADS